MGRIGHGMRGLVTVYDVNVLVVCGYRSELPLVKPKNTASISGMKICCLMRDVPSQMCRLPSLDCLSDLCPRICYTYILDAVSLSG